MPSQYFVAWWNVENLFDIEGSPRRTDKVARAIKDDIRGWTMALLDRKVDQLASVIVQMNAGAGPDLLGVCEVENEFVLTKLIDELHARLPTRRYALAHSDSPDQRGIDVAFIYDSRFFQVPAGETFNHVVMRRTATREILQVNFKTHRGRTWSVFANHWPSRSGGAHETAGYRAIAAETLAYFHERALEVHGDNTPVLAMGDFNDEPFDTSLVIHALSQRQRVKVANAESPFLWNLMWPQLGAAEGTFYYGSVPFLFDQILVNQNMLAGSPVSVVADSVRLLSFAGMVETGDYPRPVRFGGMGHALNQNGFSDHLPIGMVVEEAD
jgi:hypothetical protein